MSKWFFLTNHALTLGLIARESEITAKKIAGELQITERSVRKIIADLQDAGYIIKTKKANRNVYSIDRQLRMRHPKQRDVLIGDFLNALATKKPAEGADQPG
jgi:predicted ArsR family transcriptional regulator